MHGARGDKPKASEDALMLVIGGPEMGPPGAESEDVSESQDIASLVRRIEELEAQLGLRQQ